eukprot:6764546-Heterocapsa_arctica.AAC.1
MSIERNNVGACFGISKFASSSDVVQNDKRSAGNLMVIAIYICLSVLRGRQSEESAGCGTNRRLAEIAGMAPQCRSATRVRLEPGG